MSPPRDPEEAAAEAVLSELARAGAAPGREARPAADDEVAEVLRRLYREAFGLLAYAVDPVEPSVASRARLLERLAGEDTQEVEPLEPPAAAPAAEQRKLDAAREPSPPAAAPPRRAAAGPDEARARAGARPRRSRWPVALAILFALAAIGLGAWGAYLQSELASARGRLARAGREAAAADRGRRDEIAGWRAEVAELTERLRFVTAPALTVYALRPPATAARQPLARAALYVAAESRSWRLEARGLAPDGESQDYQVWFLIDGAPRSGGVFEATAGEAASLAGAFLPAGTDSVAITLEREGGTPAPTSGFLLVGESPVQL